MSNRVVQWIKEAGSFYLLLVALAGCASRGEVRDQVGRLEAEQVTLDRLQARLDALGQTLDRAETALSARQELVEETAEQALMASDQASEAQVRAAGRLLGETVFRLEGLGFEPGTASLTAESKTLLDQLAERLRVEDASYYLEVQTRPLDAGGSVSGGGFELAGARAEAVRRYLHVDRGLPLHALSAMASMEGLPPAVATAVVPESGVTGTDSAAAPTAVELPEEERVAVVVVRPFPRP